VKNKPSKTWTGLPFHSVMPEFRDLISASDVIALLKRDPKLRTDLAAAEAEDFFIFPGAKLSEFCGCSDVSLKQALNAGLKVLLVVNCVR
jgi:hypothetical protein